MEAIFPFLVPISITLGAFIMVIFIRKFENDERMAMIEKGLDPGMAKPKGGRFAFGTLRFALLSIGAGIGLLIGNFLERFFRFEEGIAYFSMVLLFGGLGLLASHVIQYMQEEKEKFMEREREKEKGNYLS